MSPIKALGYLGFSVSDKNAWWQFAENILGVGVSEPSSDLLQLRLDDYAWRLRLHSAERDDLEYLGWEVADKASLAQLVQRLEANDVAYEKGSMESIHEREVLDLIRFRDPDGNLCEAFYGPLQITDKPFVSPKGFQFNTGEQGLGHIVLISRDHAAMEAFYTNVLGFKISDYINTEVVPGKPLNICFMRCNSRHHSLALAPVPIKSRVAHIMLETKSIDDVGRAMDAALRNDVHLSFTLGRHSNDNMLSFYALSPSGFDVEFGWGGAVVDDDTWHVKTHKTNSAWGHKFQRPPKNN